MWTAEKHVSILIISQRSKRQKFGKKKWVTVGVYKFYLLKVFFNDFCYYFSYKSTIQVMLVVKNLASNAGDMRCGLDPWVRRSPGGSLGNSLQDSCLENLMDRGAWWAIVHRVVKSRTRLSQLVMHAQLKYKFKYIYIYIYIYF